MNPAHAFQTLNEEIVACTRCPRLRDWCETVASQKRRSFQEDDYWGSPVPNFGDPLALGLVVGLAPAAHGGNRTGRMFTGDRSGDWLYQALYDAGLANQPTSLERQDGLELRGVAVTAVCHCAPPENKPAPGEVVNCREHLERTIALRPYRAFLCLGSLAWKETLGCLGMKKSEQFGHGRQVADPKGRLVVASYHPSQQNTFTGRLTRAMLLDAVRAFASALG
ncbi:MAG: uracil-DNA glycosylase [Armatimonadetes bacterium]|nr:uracil-DNA glycosylase [Armatimonadota bacterium]